MPLTKRCASARCAAETHGEITRVRENDDDDDDGDEDDDDEDGDAGRLIRCQH